jgi:hypothetical protein
VGEWRTIGQLADRVGAYGWTEQRLFALMGQWAVGVGEAEAAVYLATASRRHGVLAEAWRDRLPRRAGVDRAALIVEPPGPLGAVLDRLDREPEGLARLAGLTAVVLPRVLATYEEHRTTGSAVCEGSVLAVLDEARREGSVEVEAGVSLMQRLGCSGDVSSEIERMFGGVAGVLPGDWAS